MWSAAGAKEPEVAHFEKALGQDVLPETVDELLGVQGAELGLASGGGAIAKGHLAVGEFDDAVVAEGDAKDVGGRYFTGGSPVLTGWPWTTPSCAQTAAGMSAQWGVRRKAARNLP